MTQPDLQIMISFPADLIPKAFICFFWNLAMLCAFIGLTPVALVAWLFLICSILPTAESEPSSLNTEKETGLYDI